MTEQATAAIIVGKLQQMCHASDLSLKVTSETRLGELSLDSLALVDMIHELETQFSVTADEEQLAQLETVDDIIRMFQGAGRAS